MSLIEKQIKIYIHLAYINPLNLDVKDFSHLETCEN